MNIGVTSNGQLFIQTQAALLSGFGLFAGVGFQATVAYSTSSFPVPVSTTSSLQGQMNAGWNRYGGGGFDVGEGSLGVGFSPKTLRGGVGYGMMVGAGVATTTTLATPPTSEWPDSLCVAINQWC